MNQPIAPIHGPEKSVPWPTPPIPNTTMLSFWGMGDQKTQPFTLPTDASLRIAVETAPMELHVLSADGDADSSVVPVPSPGLALAQIPAGGTYTLEVRTAGAWGITVVYYTPEEGTSREDESLPAHPARG